MFANKFNLKQMQIKEERFLYNSYSQYLKNIFKERVFKIPINGGFTCPNRINGGKGCSFCNNEAFAPKYVNEKDTITNQITKGIQFLSKRKYTAQKYIIYFQTYTNTYEDINILKSKYYEALSYPGVEGLVIGTRPDCINDETIEFFKEIAKTKYLLVELGLESINDKTLERVNRGHNAEIGFNMISKLHEAGIKTGIHLILGLPGESKEDMIEQCKIISQLPLTTIKFHQLQIIKDTSIIDDFENNKQDFVIFSADEYIDFVIEYIQYLNPKFVIERFISEVPPQYLYQKNWNLLKGDMIRQKIENRMKELNVWQGKKYDIKKGL